MKLIDRLQKEIDQIRGQRHQLLIIPEHIGNHVDLKGALKQLNIPLLNLNLLLSSQLKDLPPSKRPLAVGPALHQEMGKVASKIVGLEKIEYLFDPELKQDPLRLLSSLSSNKVIILLWPGEVKGKRLSYATRNHPDFYENETFIHHVIQL